MSKKSKNITFFLFEINEHQCLNTPKLLVHRKFDNLEVGECFFLLDVGVCIVKLVEAKLIRQQCFSLHNLFCYKIILEIKKIW